MTREEKKEKKSKKEKRKSEIAELPLDPVLIEQKQADDVEMKEAEAVEVVNKEKKSKKEKEKEDEIIVSVEELSPIAHPLANKKVAKKVFKTVKKASKQRQVKRGVKEVVKGIRKGERGLLVLAADISPIDIISHLPVLGEDHSIPYIFVASKEELGHASSTKRPTSCVLVCPDMKRKKRKTEDGDKPMEEVEEDYRELYDETVRDVKALDEKVVY
ncbi:snoRNA-binding protein [Tulasnella sp. 419]|nr:snoRNA-binding protein [Tulasnella sp. 418]KAG8966089.1 snoRNA-binding protein [Tulasnella sp. 419]